MGGGGGSSRDPERGFSLGNGGGGSGGAEFNATFSGYSPKAAQGLVTISLFESRNNLRNALWLLTMLGEFAIGMLTFMMIDDRYAWQLLTSAAIATLPAVAGEINLRRAHGRNNE